MTQSCANIYLADQRGCTQLDWFRSYHTFNFGDYFNENRHPFGGIRVLNDDTLRGGYAATKHVEKTTQVVLIPLVGGIYFNIQPDEPIFIEAGGLLFASITEGVDFVISSPYSQEDLVNYLEIWLEVEDLLLQNKVEKASFDINQRNQLLPLFLSEKSDLKDDFGVLSKNHAFIGKYEGRKEGVYHLKNEQSGVLIFIIEGAFEVQNRLLHSRDCLTLADVEEVEFEALSNDAIILLIETCF
jgi:quercetin 2,3-dioxygenase